MAGTRQPANRHLDKNPKGGEPEAGGKVQGERPLPRADIHRPMAHQPQDGRREHAPKVRRSGEVIRPPFRMMANGVIKTPLAGKQNYNRCPSARDANLFWRRHTPNLSQNRCDCQRRWRYYDPRLSGHDSSPIRFVKSGVNDHLRQGARGSAGSRQILGSALVSGSIALSLRLLVCAGLLLKSLSKLQHVDPGFQASGVLTLDFGMGQQKFHDWPIRTRFVERVIEGVRASGRYRECAAPDWRAACPSRRGEDCGSRSHPKGRVCGARFRIPPSTGLSCRGTWKPCKSRSSEGGCSTAATAKTHFSSCW